MTWLTMSRLAMTSQASSPISQPAAIALIEQQSEAQDTLRQTVETRLDVLRSESSQKLDEMRRAVGEKLQSTLESRITESFRIVSQHPKDVHKGLGEMQTLAAGVGDLKKVLSNVKARGTSSAICSSSFSFLISTFTTHKSRGKPGAGRIRHSHARSGRLKGMLETDRCRAPAGGLHTLSRGRGCRRQRARRSGCLCLGVADRGVRARSTACYGLPPSVKRAGSALLL